MSGGRTSTDARAPGWAPIALLLFAAGWGANQFVALLPLYRAALGLSGEQAAAVFGLYALGLVPGLLAAGPVSDRIGRRAVAIPAAVVALAGSVILAVSGDSFEGLLVGRFVVGVGSGATFSAASAWMVDLGPLASAKRTPAVLAAGFGTGPLVAGVLATTVRWPLVAPYVVQVVLLVVAIALALRAGAPPRASRLSGADEPSGLEPWMFVRRVALVAPWIFAFPALGFISLPALLERGSAPDPAFVGVISGVTLFVGALVARVVAGRPGSGAAAGLVVGSAGILLGAAAALAGHELGLLAAGVLLGAGHGWTMSTTFRLVALRSRARYRGAIVGLTYAIAYLGFGAPSLFILLAHTLGAARTLQAFAVAAVVAAVLAVDRAHRRGDDGAPASS